MTKQKMKGHLSKTERYKYVCGLISGEFTYYDVASKMKEEFPHDADCMNEVAHKVSSLRREGFLEMGGKQRYFRPAHGGSTTINKYKVAARHDI